MRKTFRVLSIAVSALALTGVLGIAPTAIADDKSALEKGKKLAFGIKKGNCLACHMMSDGDQPGNIGPPLIAMKARFPDKAVLKAQISDARAKNPNTIMPPFGTHGILTEKEIDLITDFVHSL
ncbi:sulfur oxidation c-type cytochrome SoxX [Cocleimonas flava]|jgi:sulfur-oxidizing protein SoxX|uniref:Monoheme cytochrome SoxX (Sulfur oxidation) n=1 Tax=Cocleimonas flava TaxID=634765 RepID=A0A4R1F9D2_9GAMM|nr:MULTISPECIES: sulfur oxidation c-type cytochrome SoxX [Cocleimonas]MEB8431671.1 sulfur oxidation c-type cytochrome SoxX [Cocleimonas sp. KMM 6892]MEC4713557.1 sulfur oxidation c-type cytochrome SoxX [Cocleimonas sp. KMM 6895]MEC4742888.1 sulfur oxidation c-type cytochrome SoxX [Cocleimonas sp. KMM 6896]TCJ89359.1 monoheme cytochrome SoxX (sulfur oxidation) [Cocleimonas flava]